MHLKFWTTFCDICPKNKAVFMIHIRLNDSPRTALNTWLVVSHVHLDIWTTMPRMTSSTCMQGTQVLFSTKCTIITSQPSYS